MNNILIVEDDYTNRFVFKQILCDYNLLFLENGLNLEKKIQEFKPDLILLDVMLPDINGFDIARNLSQRDEFNNIPIIFVTAKDEPVNLAKGLNLGAYDYITKPINETILIARITSTLNKKAKENKLYEETITDPLTLVHNRRYFFYNGKNQLQYAVRENKNFSIALLDIDFFKNINDKYGHLIGDSVLKNFASIIKNSIRPYDLLARYGGEEFILLLIDCDKQSAFNILDRLRSDIDNKTFEVDSEIIHFTFSCGISDFFESNQNENLEKIIQKADERLYFAKKSGRNRISIE